MDFSFSAAVPFGAAGTFVPGVVPRDNSHGLHNQGRRNPGDMDKRLGLHNRGHNRIQRCVGNVGYKLTHI